MVVDLGYCEINESRIGEFNMGKLKKLKLRFSDCDKSTTIIVHWTSNTVPGHNFNGLSGERFKTAEISIPAEKIGKYNEQ